MRRGPASPHRPYQVAGTMAARGLPLLPIGAVVLFAGMLVYHLVEGLPWPDAFLNASMLLGGMGPVSAIHTTAGKWLAGFYALFAGLFFIVLAGTMLGPVMHSVLRRFHLEKTEHVEES